MSLTSKVDKLRKHQNFELWRLTTFQVKEACPWTQAKKQRKESRNCSQRRKSCKEKQRICTFLDLHSCQLCKHTYATVLTKIRDTVELHVPRAGKRNFCIPPPWTVCAHAEKLHFSRWVSKDWKAFFSFSVSGAGPGLFWLQVSISEFVIAPWLASTRLA